MRDISFKNERVKLDVLLANIAESIQLDNTRKERMESAYSAIETLLNEDESFFKDVDFEIYPQGSVKIGTTIKPMKDNEFDLDIVVQIVDFENSYDSEEIYNQLKRVLLSSRYKDKVVTKNRCIRIDYAGDFHMDILPGVQVYTDDKNKIVVPDKKLETWTPSNPRGYAEWFLDKSNKVIEPILEKAFSMEALEMEEFAKKKPLKRTVQLLKLYRDEYFKNDLENATSSIILTTIAGELYNSESSIYDSMENILNNIDLYINNNEAKIVNPVNPDENFTDKWIEEPNLKFHFIKFVQYAKELWMRLKEDNGVQTEITLKSLFSENAYQVGLESFDNFISKSEKIYEQDFTNLEQLATTSSPTHKPYMFDNE